MKKSLKITLLTVAGLTVLVTAAAAIMLKAVLGDALFYMNSRLGGVYAVSCRWVCLASGILILFWILLAVRNRGAIAAKLPKFKRKPKKDATAQTTIAATAPPVVICAHCGRPLTAANKFCPQCGKPVNLAPPEV